MIGHGDRTNFISLTNQNPFCGSTKKSFMEEGSISIVPPIKINQSVYK
jgi:hypothetical protein